MKKLSSREIDEQAARWAAQVDAGPLDPKSETELRSWIAADDRHFGAYAKARAVLAYADRAKALGPSFDGSEIMPDEPAGLPGASRRRVLVGSVAAGLGVAAASALVLIPRLGTKSFSTGLGETRVVPLSDGSVVTLNTNSRVEVRYSAERREIALLRGEALFDVAKNKTRPFIVDAAGTAVRAVGTSFTVSVLPERPVEVLVREGIVELTRPTIPAAQPVLLKANSKAAAPRDLPIEVAIVHPVEVARATSWQLGRLSFEGEPLASAAAAFVRYSDTRIIIDDPEIGRKTVTGLFVSNDPVGFARAAALSLSLHLEVKEDSVQITR